eukprot:CAMPEP_0180678476 /NCGR_PEP_ID=MMETSP1037_2-20121125/68400_1 /TAXON_ID=632150 /ORGANISM="Azadinium spinosum, Strain 3D9" /LENGTH=339 /DNA_ID=CAMNT_0022708117 /DNA_START=41 /DNA_END=1061 /DNA_ORIENTATION=+
MAEIKEIVQGVNPGGELDDLREKLFAGNINDELEDELLKQGVSNELLQAWRTQLMNTQGRGQDKGWFDAVTLFDVYCKNCPGGVKIELLPATCVSLVKVLKKVDISTINMKGSNLSVHATQLAQWLRQLGYTLEHDVTEEQLSQQELELMSALAWQINLPSVLQWVSMFSSRFNVFTQNLFLPSLNWVWESGMFYMRMVVMRQASSEDFLPRRMANGLLGLGFIGARLLPVEALRPSKLTPADWEQLFTQSQLQGVVPTCVLQPSHCLRVIEFLQAATDSSLEEIKEDCEAVANLVKDGILEMQNMQRAAEAIAANASTTQASEQSAWQHVPSQGCAGH